MIFNSNLKITQRFSNAVVIMTLILFVILITYGIVGVPNTEGKYAFSKKWGELGTGGGEFNNPGGVAVSHSGILYVADTGNNRIQQFRLATPCPSGTSQIVTGVCFVKTWGALGTGNGQFNNPSDVAIDSSERVYVADTGNNRIQMFRDNGNFIRAWNADGPGTTQFTHLTDVSVDTSSGEIFVADSRDGQGLIHKFRLANPCPAGTTQVAKGICFSDRFTYGEIPEVPPDPLYSILGVEVNPITHDVYVSNYVDIQHPPDGDEYWIIRKGVDGQLIRSWGGTVSGFNGKFDRPSGIAIGPSGLVYVADGGNNRIQAFQQTLPCPVGTTQIAIAVCLYSKWGTQGSADGQFSGPKDVSVGGPLGHIFVADTGNHRIQEFYWKTDVGGPIGGGIEPNIAVK